MLQARSPIRAGREIARESALENCPSRWLRIRGRLESTDVDDL
ncbi:hypothetical protein [Natrinema saccharevitans]|nr:hypothetical protein [Natrinema saccharevitans]